MGVALTATQAHSSRLISVQLRSSVRYTIPAEVFMTRAVLASSPRSQVGRRYNRCTFLGKICDCRNRRLAAHAPGSPSAYYQPSHEGGTLPRIGAHIAWFARS